MAGQETLRGKTVVNLFFENSTRTRTSFELAGKRLSADVVNVNVAASSATKGEALRDTVATLDAMAPDVIVVDSEEDFHKLPKFGRLGIVSQTTHSAAKFGEMVGKIVGTGKFREVKILNTLCSEVTARQEAAVDLSKEVDVMFVLGGLHSANTRKLAELCKKHNPQTYHLQNWAELDKSHLFGKMTAGVTAGASTPDEVIEVFVRNLERFNSAEKKD